MMDARHMAFHAGMKPPGLLSAPKKGPRHKTEILFVNIPSHNKTPESYLLSEANTNLCKTAAIAAPTSGAKIKSHT